MWAKHFFVLTDEKLFFTEQQDKEEEPEKEDEPEVRACDSHVIELFSHVINHSFRFHQLSYTIRRSGFMAN